MITVNNETVDTKLTSAHKWIDRVQLAIWISFFLLLTKDKERFDICSENSNGSTFVP